MSVQQCSSQREFTVYVKINLICLMLVELQVNSGTEESESLITYLVQSQADVNIRDYYGMTPLHYAASKGNLTAVKELLQVEGIKVDVSNF